MSMNHLFQNRRRNKTSGLEVPFFWLWSILLLVFETEGISAGAFTVEMPHELNVANGIVGAFMFPHGAITLDPQTRNFSGIPAVKPDSKEKCIRLHDAMQSQADLLVSKKPDLIILSTPHGLKIQNSYLFLANKKVKGTAQWDGEWTDFTAEFDIETTLSNLLVEKLTRMDNPVEKLGIGAPEDTLPLRWGEVIPWHFINEAAKRVNFTLPPVVFIGQPSKRMNGTKQIIPELIKLGNDIHKVILEEPQLNKKVAFVISSDLSHAHSNDSTSPYPYHPSSVVFDGFVNDWAKLNYTSGNVEHATEILTEKAGNIVDTALSCGYTGLVMLHGVFQHAIQNGYGFLFNGTLMEYSVPTYYGMMVNHWLPSLGT